MNIHFKPVQESDLTKIKKIYDYYIVTSTATFHTEPITIQELRESIYINHPTYLSFGVFREDELMGFTYLCPYKKRQAYNRSAEITLYFQPEITGKGIGKTVIQFMHEEAKKVGLKNLLAVICAENMESIQLFQKNDYVQCAHFKNVGEKFERILDVVMYQKEL